MSDGIEALPRSQFRGGDLAPTWGPPCDAARGVAVAIMIAVPFWAVLGGVAWLLLG